MKVFITGGTGFIGRSLVRALLDSGWHPVVLSRDPGRAMRSLPAGATVVGGDPSVKGGWMEEVPCCQAAVNLCGEPIFGRWTPSKREAIESSRILPTRNLAEAVPAGADFTLISSSAVGYYGFRGEEPIREEDPPGSDWLAGVAVRWEAEARRASDKGCRVVLLRTGIVLGAGGGALQQMITPFKLYGGGPIGSGQQYLSWIHLEDVTGLVRFALENRGLAGPLNAVSPKPVTNARFAETLGKVLGRPSLVRVPAFALRLAMGEFAEVALRGQRVMPARALAAGYSFRHPELEEALRDILHRELLPAASRA